MGVKLQSLELDFVRRRRISPWVGRALLAIAVAFAGDVGISLFKLKGDLVEARARLERGANPRVAARKASPEEIAAARETVQRLSLPWSELFTALEGAASEQVALLAIEPDPRNGTVVISGDSKDYLAALTYVLNLSRAETLSRVQLVRHEAKQNAVGFSVSATWSAGKG
ncbi:MAG: PilN domain-containing protein [Betaproteobacteria bacterium]